MSEPTPAAPSLPAIRARLASALAEVEQRRDLRPVPPHQEALLRDALALLEECDRLRVQVTDLRAALDGTALVRLGDASLCWCPHARPHGNAGRTEHTEACLAARAALGEEG